MEEDDAILLIIGDEVNQDFPMPASSVQIKLEPDAEEIDQCNYSELDPQSILESAELHGEYIDLFEVENLDCDYLEIHSERKPYKYKNREESSESDSNDDENCKSPKPLHSYIKQLCKNFPKMRKDENYLVAHLTELMKNTKPPIPPIDFCQNIDGKLACAYCDAVSFTLPIASRHYQKKHGTRYLACYACGADYRCTTGLYKHEKRCIAPGARLVLKARGRYLGRKGRRRPYLTLNKFQPHDSKNQTKKELYCTQCTATFKHKDALTSHEYMHRGIRPYQCDQCPVAYTSAIALKRHLLIHTDLQYICDVCGRSFKTKTTLIVHMNTHLPQRKYPCDRCERRFAQKSALQHHINRDHLNIPPPFACAACPKRFPRMSNLKQHMKAKHGLTLMTRKMFFKALPTMKETELKQATIVFNNFENDVITAPLETSIFNKTGDAKSVADDISTKSESEDSDIHSVEADALHYEALTSEIETEIVPYDEKEATEISETEEVQESIESQLERILGTDDEAQVKEEVLDSPNNEVIQSSLQDGCELEFVKFISQRDEDEKKSTSRIPRIDLRILQMHKNIQAHTRGRDMPVLKTGKDESETSNRNMDEIDTEIANAANKKVNGKQIDKKINEGPMKTKTNVVRRDPVQTRSGVMKTRSGAIMKSDVLLKEKRSSIRKHR